MDSNNNNHLTRSEIAQKGAFLPVKSDRYALQRLSPFRDPAPLRNIAAGFGSSRYDTAFAQTKLLFQVSLVLYGLNSILKRSSEDPVKYSLFREIHAAAESLQTKRFEEAHTFLCQIRITIRLEMYAEDNR